MPGLFCSRILLPDGWAENIRLEWDEAGRITAVTPDSDVKADGHLHAPGPVVPGMMNLHSHAFQRAMAGEAEIMVSREDSFWSWRERMYELALTITPADARRIAETLGRECLAQGFTGICEFHYLHHDIDGRAYANPAEMSIAVVEGLRAAGMAVTHLPVLYRYGGFGGAALSERQRRFATDAASRHAIAEATRKAFADDPLVRVGTAFHSLRAADAAEIRDALSLGTEADGPIHIHIAEQVKEVADCREFSGLHPVEWLFDNAPVDERWCLVHATHMSDSECDMLAASGAVAGLCPMTEGNLGDGFFALERYREKGGIWGIGTDSHVSRDAAEELRFLEYGQRLLHQKRNRVASEASPSVGGTLWREALFGGARASGQPVGAIAVGKRADFLILDEDHPAVAGRKDDGILDGWIFSGCGNPIAETFVGGRKVHER